VAVMMEILDAQVHTWLPDRPSLPWDPTYRKTYSDAAHLQHVGQSMAPETLLVEMAEAGVDGAVLVPVGVYGTDNSFELNAAMRFPRRFAVVGSVDHMSADVADRLQHDVARGMRGIRIGSLGNDERLARDEFVSVLEACKDLDLSVSFMLFHPVPEALLQLLKRFADVNFLLDHVGVGVAPPVFGSVTGDPFSCLDEICGLATLPNVFLKLTGAPVLSREPYPFEDIWAPVMRLIEAFGPERVMWGSDFTRTQGFFSYWEGVEYLKRLPGLTRSDRSQIYAHSLRRVLGWSNPDS
jgi:L-fuconolactonase